MLLFIVNLCNLIVILLGLFLIGLVLIHAGKGGGLAGAFGGVGGSSPFGSKAGDTFTKITIWVAAIWIVVIMAQVRWAKQVDATGAANIPGVSKSGS